MATQKSNSSTAIWIALIMMTTACRSPEPPAPLHPIPTAQQLAWQDLEYYAFVHFNMNTFSNMEWGFGDEAPAQFNPTELDCRQWARVCKEAGMRGIILTAKHHDGFCLWPSAYTEHSVKNSPWKDGKGDIVRELADACREYGLEFGIYYSPWDRNHADYGKPEYITYMRNQLRELLTQYGELFEVWFDGANGGTGYYGGANEERRVDKRSYYGWPETHKLIRELQPNAVIFSDAGPDVRWVGNEHGFAYPTTWSMLMRDSVYAGMPEYSKKFSSGQENGTHWVPAEADVSIRPGWYYHPYEDHKVKSLAELVEIYYRSIGQNATLLLNLPVDTRGLVHENDVSQLQKLARKIREDFAVDLALNAKVESSVDRGYGYQAANLVDGNTSSYWAAPDSATSAVITINFDQELQFNRIVLQEHIALGQRIKSFRVEAKNGESWQEIAKGTTVGAKRILRIDDKKASGVRINLDENRAAPTLGGIGIYNAPPLVVPPKIRRDKSGRLILSVPESGVNIHYTLDGDAPDVDAAKYEAPITVETAVHVQAIAIDPGSGRKSEISNAVLDIPKTRWRVIHPDANAQRVIDDDPDNWWGLPEDENVVVIDLGERLKLNGFTYLPMQARWISGFISEYAFSVSSDGRSWQQVAEGEFGNILNSPIEQRIAFVPITARFLRFEARRTVDGQPATFAEIGILTR